LKTGCFKKESVQYANRLKLTIEPL